jgi:WD40 repeat protein
LVTGGIARVDLWRIPDGILLTTIQTGDQGDISAVAFSPNGQCLASGGSDVTVKLWQVSDGGLIRTFTGHTDGVNVVAFSPDGNILASGSRDHTIKLWRVSDGALLRSLSGHTGSVDAVLFSPDGQTLVSGSSDQTIRVWRVADGVLLLTLQGCSPVTLSPDGRVVASGSADNVIDFWRVTDGGLLATFDEETRPWPTSLVFSPDGELIAWGRGDGTVVVARVPDTTPPSTPVIMDEGQFLQSGAELSTSWTSSDPESGVVEYQYAIGTSATDPGSGYLVGWKSAGTATEATETGLTLQDGLTYYWYVRARNGAGLWSEVGVSDGITVDRIAPDTSITGGPANSSLSRNADATFTFGGTDNLTTSSELRFQWRLDGVEWNEASTDTTVHLTNLADGVHTFQVRAVDLGGNVDPTPASVTWRVLAGSLPVEASGAGRAKLQADGVELLLTGCVVTAAPGQAAAGRAYVESLDCSSGLALLTDAPVAEGDLVEVAGRMGTTSDGERVVQQAFVRVVGPAQPLEPVRLTLRGCAGRAFFHSPATGAGQRGVTDPPGRGLNTTGLLVQVTGRVNEIGPEFALLNDGSFPYMTGVRVDRSKIPATVQVGDMVNVTAISSLRRAGTAYQLLLRPRSSADFQVVTHAEEP